jgi:predicted dehydrogenase
MNMPPIRAILIGAGQRGGKDYASYALSNPDQIKFTTVAEPIKTRRERFATIHHIPPEGCFESWEALLDKPQLGEAAIIATQDWLHTAPALAAMRNGYHILLEKPMATTADECRELVSTSEETGKQLHVCHVLRYTRHFRKMREIVKSGDLGEVVDVAHRENVSFWHMAHSYVRGNWANGENSTPMILAKCCHDLDILPWVLGDYPVMLSSQGNLHHFKPGNAPAGAPLRCTDGCPAAENCPYFAPWIYMDMAPFWNSYRHTSRRTLDSWICALKIDRPVMVKNLARFIPWLNRIAQYKEWPISVLTDEPTDENILDALRNGPYGRCVYHCENDVVDHQVVVMTFNRGATVTLTMHGHSHIEHRSTRIEGTRGRLLGELGNGGAWISVENHRSGKKYVVETSPPAHEGHGGGDTQLMADFVTSVRRGGNPTDVIQAAREALASHLLAFSAEEARLTGNTMDVSKLYKVGKND